MSFLIYIYISWIRIYCFYQYLSSSYFVRTQELRKRSNVYQSPSDGSKHRHDTVVLCGTPVSATVIRWIICVCFTFRKLTDIDTSG